MNRPRFAYLPVLATIVGGLLVTAFISWMAAQVAQRHDADVFRADVRSFTRQLEQGFQRSGEVLFDLRSLLPKPLKVANLPPSTDLAPLLSKEQTNGLIAVGIALAVRPDELAEHESNMRNRLGTNYHVSPAGSAYKIFLHDHQSEEQLTSVSFYLPIVQFEFIGNYAALDCCHRFQLGTDLLRVNRPELASQFQPVIDAVGDGALRTGALLSAISDEPNRSPEFTIPYYLPIFSDGTTTSMAGSVTRLRELQGVLIATLNVADRIRGIIDFERTLFEAEIFWGRREYNRRVLHQNVFSSRKSSRRWWWFQRPYQTTEDQFRVGDYYLFVNACSSPKWDFRSTRFSPWLTLVVGIALTGFSGRYVAHQIREKLLSDAEATELRTTNAVLAAARETREHITRELHDNTLQTLYALSLELRQSLECLRVSPEDASSALRRCLDEIRHVSAELRQFLVGQQSNRQTLGAIDVLTAVVERFQRGVAAQIELQIEPGAATLLSTRDIAESTQIVREAISNAIRHGNPQRITIELKNREMNGWELQVRDDGCGFDVSALNKTGFGLAHLRSRAEAINAHFEVESMPGRGTTIRVFGANATNKA